MSKYGIVRQFDDSWLWLLPRDANLNDENVKPRLFENTDEAYDHAEILKLNDFEVHSYPLRISYSLNAMGPASIDWYKERNLIKKVEKKVESQLIADLLDKNIGDTYIREKIEKEYVIGRIDIRGVPFEPFNLEYGIEMMTARSWNSLSKWLINKTTEMLLTKEELIAEFEKETNEKIEWYKD